VSESIVSEPPEDYEPIDLRSPIVEERLYSSLLCLSCLKRLALLAATERENMQMVNELPAFAWMARRFIIATERHLVAIKAVLPASATNLQAPVRRRKE